MAPHTPSPWNESEDYKQNRQLWLNSVSEIFKKILPYYTEFERKSKEELYWEAANICAMEDKDLKQLASASSLTNVNKKRDMEEQCKSAITKAFQDLMNANKKASTNQKKAEFED
ncbi:hypothetical protein AMATHDRAFT_10977 [Amanita thiersii Skay4041]|uniref:Uncharacterized protein n=1 Tax=Amanita thiersii Skay4041 TaxID=703135 RepID=A0A2A9N9A7_9AGAR|nr:hypothetical protein AMATHDRAFT_10977 [Amanita thiersii Skay4041]